MSTACTGPAIRIKRLLPGYKVYPGFFWFGVLPMTDEELGALLLRKTRAENRILKLNAEIKTASASLLKLADTLASNPGDIQFKNLPGEVGQWPERVGRRTEFEWAQVDTANIVRRLIDLFNAQAEIDDADKQIGASGSL